MLTDPIGYMHNLEYIPFILYLGFYPLHYTRTTPTESCDNPFLMKVGHLFLFSLSLTSLCCFGTVISFSVKSCFPSFMMQNPSCSPAYLKPLPALLCGCSAPILNRKGKENSSHNASSLALLFFILQFSHPLMLLQLP